MKNIALLISILLSLASAFHVQAQRTISGPVTINLTASQQFGGRYTPISSRTNQTATTTNIINVAKNTVTNLVVNDAFLIDLLANSYKTNFPAGAMLFLVQSNALRLTDYEFYVTDKTGTNILLTPSLSVIGITEAADSFTLKGLQTAIDSQTKSGTAFSGNDTELSAQFVLLTYDDSSLATGDGTQSYFICYGVLMGKYSQNYATGKTTESVSLSGSGCGTIRNEFWILANGSLTAALAGIVH